MTGKANLYQRKILGQIYIQRGSNSQLNFSTYSPRWKKNALCQYTERMCHINSNIAQIVQFSTYWRLLTFNKSKESCPSEGKKAAPCVWEPVCLSFVHSDWVVGVVRENWLYPHSLYVPETKREREIM